MNNIEYGFKVKLVFENGLSEQDYDSITDEFIMDAIEKNDLLFGGGGDLNEYEGFVTSADNNKRLDNHDIEKVRKWIETKKKVIKNFELSDRIDANK